MAPDFSPLHSRVYAIQSEKVLIEASQCIDSRHWGRLVKIRSLSGSAVVAAENLITPV